MSSASTIGALYNLLLPIASVQDICDISVYAGDADLAPYVGAGLPPAILHRVLLQRLSRPSPAPVAAVPSASLSGPPPAAAAVPSASLSGAAPAVPLSGPPPAAAAGPSAPLPRSQTATDAMPVEVN
ncbi:hypothetical protein DIPPA_63504, partial [Diplonema papillatum]